MTVEHKRKRLMYHIVSERLRLMNKLTEAQAEADLIKIGQKGETKSPMPKGLDVTFENDVFYVNKDSASDHIVFYIHGGGYQHDFSPFHWKFIRKIIEHTDAAVIAPAYHLIPFGTCRDAFDLIVPLYQKYSGNYPEKKIIIMGDSAGGGLSLALTEYFKAEGIRLPDEVILLSPWVDVSMENPDISDYVRKDPWLSVPWAKVCGRHWVGTYDIHDYRVSPIHGDVSGLKNITVFAGTRELAYPDAIKMYNMLDKQGNELIVAGDMLHVFPLMPIPEARQYQSMIFEIIRR